MFDCTLISKPVINASDRYICELMSASIRFFNLVLKAVPLINVLSFTYLFTPNSKENDSSGLCVASPDPSVA